MADFMMFFRRFISEPGRIGSIMPSSRFLCEQMLKHVAWDSIRLIVELGPGTGVFTAEILARKREHTHFLVVERDDHFRQILRERYPQLMIGKDAAKLATYIEEKQLPLADVIISGLPFANFPREVRTAILDNVYAALAPGGKFVAFQYSLQLKSELKQRFKQVEISFTPINVPPAFVYTCYK